MTTTARSLHPGLRPYRRAAARVRLLRGVATLALGALGLAATLAAAGAGFEWVAGAGDAAAHPPTGRLVDVGGYRLHLDCRGEGSPTVVLDAGLGGSSLDWSLVQPALARIVRVCTYDRAGMGWSEAGPAPRSPSHLAGDLHALLQAGGVPGPYLMVGHSLAGKTVRMFAAAYPVEVAGMVLVDARSEALETAAETAAFAAVLDGQAALFATARRLGLVRLAGGAILDLPLVPPALAARMALLATNPAAIAATTQEGLNQTADDAALAATTLGSMPLVVIGAGETMGEPRWAAAQAALARLSTNGQLVVAEGSGHAVHLDRPAIVIRAIARVVDGLRRSH